MNIGSICKRRIVAIDSASTLAQAAVLMRDQHVGALVITVLYKVAISVREQELA